jgi:hypothetical protein
MSCEKTRVRVDVRVVVSQSWRECTANVAHTVLLEGQHDGHLAPGVYTGSVPGSQNPSSPKHSHVWSLVSSMPLPGQQALSHLQSGVVQFGHSVWHRDSVGSTAGGSQNPIAAKQSHA